jgi:hypothetical protein
MLVGRQLKILVLAGARRNVRNEGGGNLNEKGMVYGIRTYLSQFSRINKVGM